MDVWLSRAILDWLEAFVSCQGGGSGWPRGSLSTRQSRMPWMPPSGSTKTVIVGVLGDLWKTGCGDCRNNYTIPPPPCIPCKTTAGSFH